MNEKGEKIYIENCDVKVPQLTPEQRAEMDYGKGDDE